MLYKEVNDYIENYEKTVQEFDWEDFFDGLQETVQKLYPADKVEVWSWEVENDTFEIDGAFDSILCFAKDNDIVAYSINWDAPKENLIITIVYKG